ncbi:hypothetical protein M9H77_27868 [Catharanthus roseus]|uniref:Uncharacterized protein n=1 Tax=Catharanthus roseus TaxID=4058 RepID=A0ACC0AFL6_CATRO|nr:hypothetical protein M9H77_27868 [Catharanthus roseus]
MHLYHSPKSFSFYVLSLSFLFLLQESPMSHISSIPSITIAIAISFFLLFTSLAESHIQKENQQVNPTTNGYPSNLGDFHGWLNVPADEQAHLRQYIKAKLEATTMKTKEFITMVIFKHLNDQMTDKSTKECLKICRDSYEAAIVSMQEAINEISHDNYYQTTAGIHKFSVSLEACTNCSGNKIAQELEFKQFQEWVHAVTSDCTDRLQKYID